MSRFPYPHKLIQLALAALECIILACICSCPAQLGPNSDSHTLHLGGTIVDSTKCQLPDRVVVLFLDGQELKRDVSEDVGYVTFQRGYRGWGSINFSLSLEDAYGFREKYDDEFGIDPDEYGIDDPSGTYFDLGAMMEGETRYLFVQDEVDPAKLHELVVMVLPGHASTVAPERMALGPGEIQARQVLIDQVRFWTRVHAQPWVETGTGAFGTGTTTYEVRYYLTYLSPQLVEAAIEYKAAQERLSSEESMELVEEVRQRLRQHNAIPFLLRIAANKSDLTLQMQPFSENVFLQNTKGEKYNPTEYDRVFDYPYELSTVEEGYVFFPRTQGTTTTVDLDNDPSIFLRIEEARLSTDAYGPRTDAIEWRFDLVPVDFPLEELALMPPPQGQSGTELSIGDILNTIDLIFTILTLFLPT
jgi:hypothetical protein